MHDLLIEAKTAALELADAIDCLDEQIQDGTALPLALKALARVKEAYRKAREKKRLLPSKAQITAMLQEA